MADAAAGKITGRPRRTPSKKAVEKSAAVEAALKGLLDDLTPDQLAEMGPREGLLHVMRGALRSGALPLFMEIATALMPYMHAKQAPLARRTGSVPSVGEIAADPDPDMGE